MTTAPRFHVIGLDPVQQIAVRFLLKNAFTAWVDSVIKDAKDFGEHERQEKSAYTFNLFKRYNEITDLLTTKDRLAKAKGVCLILTPEGMGFIRSAANNFNDKDCYLSIKEIEAVKRTIDPLKDKIEAVSKYTYTREEIDKVQKE